MKILRPWILTCAMFLVSCGGDVRRSAVEGADLFVESIAVRLREIGAESDVGGSVVWDARIHVRDLSYLLPVGKFSGEEIRDVAELALADWKPQWQLGFRTGGGSDHFHLNFGSEESYAFIDVDASESQSGTRVTIRVRIVE